MGGAVLTEPAAVEAKRAACERKSGTARKRGHAAPLGAARLSEEGASEAAGASLCGCQAQEAGEGVWDAEQADRHLTSRGGTGFARQPRGPGQPPMYSLLAGQGRISMGGLGAGPGATSTSTRWSRTNSRQARRCRRRLQSCQSTGAEATASGCKSRLTRRGCLAACPCH